MVGICLQTSLPQLQADLLYTPLCIVASLSKFIKAAASPTAQDFHSNRNA
jgi:hypothetical protein